MNKNIKPRFYNIASKIIKHKKALICRNYIKYKNKNKEYLLNLDKDNTTDNSAPNILATPNTSRGSSVYKKTRYGININLPKRLIQALYLIIAQNVCFVKIGNIVVDPTTNNNY